MSEIDDRMAALKARFSERAGEEIAAIEAAIDSADAAELQRRAHKLAGIAPMFGHADLGEAALDLETAAETGMDCQAPAARVIALLKQAAA